MVNKLPSNKSFGYFFSLVFLFFTILDFIKHDLSSIGTALFLASLFFFIGGAINSKILSPLNKSWFFLGKTLNKISSPIILGIIFFLMITPISLLSRVFGRDELKIHKFKCKTYWIKPFKSSIDAESFKNQF